MSLAQRTIKVWQAGILKWQICRIVLTEMIGSELGADVIEYAMLGVFMALVGVVLLHGITAMVGNSFNGFGTAITSSV